MMEKKDEFISGQRFAGIKPFPEKFGCRHPPCMETSRDG